MDEKVTSSEEKVTSSEQNVTSNKQKVTSNEQKRDEKRAKTNEPRATSKTFSLVFSNRLFRCCACTKETYQKNVSFKFRN